MAKLKLPPISPLIGADLWTFFRVVAKRSIRPQRWLHITLTFIIIVLLAPFRLFDIFYFRRRLKNYRLTSSPIFIIGHWRSGTTFLHNILSKDDRAAYVTTYHSVFPNHLKIKSLFGPLMRRVMPEYRPGDNIKMNIHYPQEEEYPLGNVTPCSLYHFFYFPQDYRNYFEKFVRFNGISPETKSEFVREYTTLVKKACLDTGGEIPLLKNPANTGRIKLLLQHYPQAKFVHIIRNPVEVYCSARKFFWAIIPTLSFQKISQEALSQTIFWLYENLMHDYLATRKLIPQQNLCEIRYEKLLAHPVEEIEKLYRQFHLRGDVRDNTRMIDFIAAQKRHKTDKYELTRDELNTILKRWGFAMKTWGYQVPDNVDVVDK